MTYIKVIFLLFFINIKGHSLVLESNFNQDSAFEDWFGITVDIYIDIFNHIEKDAESGKMADYSKAPLDPNKPFWDYPEENTSWLVYFGPATIPGTNRQGFLHQGNNHSDDMDYWIIRKLSLNQDYETLDNSVKFYTNHSAVGEGVGGNENFELKICIFKNDPFAVITDNNHVHFPRSASPDNPKKGQTKCEVLGETAVSNQWDPPYKSKTLSVENISLKHFNTADSDIWIGIGFHSGFESFTSIFYEEIFLEFR